MLPEVPSNHWLLFVTRIRQLSRLLAVGTPVQMSHKLFSCRSSCFLVTFLPLHSVSHLSFTDRCSHFHVHSRPPLPTHPPGVGSRWLCSIMSDVAMVPLTLRCIWLQMINVVYSWVYVNILSVILNSDGFKKMWYQLAFSVISELCEYHNCC